MEEILEQVTFVAKENIRDDIRVTSQCPAGVGLDPRTLAILKSLVNLKLIVLAEKIFESVHISLFPVSEKEHPRKEVSKMTESERCVLFAVIGVIVQIIGSYVIARKTAKSVVDEFKNR